MIGGNEGVGVVQKVGKEVSSLKQKDTVMVIRPYKGTLCFFSLSDE